MTDDASIKIYTGSGEYQDQHDVIEVRSDTLVIKSQPFRWRTIKYKDIESFEIQEFVVPPRDFQSTKPMIGLSLRLSAVPDFISAVKRDTELPDSYYLSEFFCFDINRREEVRYVASAIEERRQQANPTALPLLHTCHH